MWESSETVNSPGQPYNCEVITDPCILFMVVIIIFLWLSFYDIISMIVILWSGVMSIVLWFVYRRALLRKLKVIANLTKTWLPQLSDRDQRAPGIGLYLFTALPADRKKSLVQFIYPGWSDGLLDDTLGSRSSCSQFRQRFFVKFGQQQ